MKQKFQGFTLIEVMVVVVILGILAAIIVPKVMDRPDTARLVKAKTDIRAIESALNLYKLDNFNYPSTDEGLEALIPKYIERMANDPWGNPYLYLSRDYTAKWMYTLWVQMAYREERTRMPISATGMLIRVNRPL